VNEGMDEREKEWIRKQANKGITERTNSWTKVPTDKGVINDPQVIGPTVIGSYCCGVPAWFCIVFHVSLCTQLPGEAK